MIKKSTLKLKIISLIPVLFLPIFVSFLPNTVEAASLCITTKCKQAEAAMDKAREAQAAAAKEKDSYKAEVAKIQAEIDQIQAEINQNNEEIKQLDFQIEAAEKRLDNLKQLLAQAIVQEYLNQQISAIEVLASAKTVGDFTEEQSSQLAVKDQAKKLSKEVKQTKNDLKAKKIEVEQKKSDNETRKQEADSRRAEQQLIVNEYAGKEAEYNKVALANKKVKEAEEEKQRLANIQYGGGGTIVSGDPNKGGYPAKWANAPRDSLVDSWGMYNRECVSYTAWKVYQTYGNMPYWGGHGNAKQWTANARAAGIPTGSIPKVKSVGISYGGPYGHAIWVESINADGTINLSEYNYTTPKGNYGERRGVKASSYDYIYFGEWQR